MKNTYTKPDIKNRGMIKPALAVAPEDGGGGVRPPVSGVSTER
ncbi:hypothetical protein [Hoeflea sp.]